MELTFRRRARERAVQVLYSWMISHNDLLEIKSYFVMENDMKGVNLSYFHELCVGVAGNASILDNLMKPYLSWNFNKLGYIELIVIRIATFELLKCPDIPYKVVINEAIELAKTFGGEKSYKFVNGVLDKVAMKIRFFNC